MNQELKPIDPDALAALCTLVQNANLNHPAPKAMEALADVILLNQQLLNLHGETTATAKQG